MEFETYHWTSVGRKKCYLCGEKLHNIGYIIYRKEVIGNARECLSCESIEKTYHELPTDSQ